MMDMFLQDKSIRINFIIHEMILVGKTKRVKKVEKRRGSSRIPEHQKWEKNSLHQNN
jgi:hypothetical protein